MCDDDTSDAAAEHVIHQKGLQANVAFILEVMGINVITIT